jgi:hypothetical protein
MSGYGPVVDTAKPAPASNQQGQQPPQVVGEQQIGQPSTGPRVRLGTVAIDAIGRAETVAMWGRIKSALDQHRATAGSYPATRAEFDQLMATEQVPLPTVEANEALEYDPMTGTLHVITYDRPLAPGEVDPPQ